MSIAVLFRLVVESQRLRRHILLVEGVSLEKGAHLSALSAVPGVEVSFFFSCILPKHSHTFLGEAIARN